jgi:hypothetical protein
MNTTGTVSATLFVLTRIFRTGLLWWGGGIAVGFLTVSWFLSSLGDPDRSVWAYSGSWVRWVLLVIGILVAPLLFRVLVAHGITRRGFAVASAAGIGLLAAATGGYMAAGFLVERAFYAAGDDPPTLMQPHLFDSTGQFHLVFAEYALLAGAYLVSGWLIGVGYLGVGWFFGTLALPLAAIPVAAVELLFGTALGGGGFNPNRVTVTAPDLPVVVTLLLAAAAIGLGLLAGRWLLHSVPVKAKTS